MAVYNFRADQCPVLPTPISALQNATSENPLVNEALSLGDSIALMHKSNRNMLRAEILGRYGSGAYAVMTGLGLSIGTGLNVVVAAGQALIDGPRTITANTNVAVPNGTALGSLWMTQAGALSPSSNLTPPAGNVCYLGLYTSSGGAVTVVDESGVLRFDQGSFPMRRTADTTTPTDTPPAGLRFLTKCPGGIYLWDGSAYWTLAGDQSALLPMSVGSGETFTIPAGRQAVMEELTVLGSLVVNGRLRVGGF